MNLAVIYLSKVNSGNTRAMCEICSKLTIKTSDDVVLVSLRYYATFKVRKFESLFYKINTFLQKLPLALDYRQSKCSL